MNTANLHPGRTTLLLAAALAVLSAASLFTGAIDMTPSQLLAGDPALLEVFLASRLPRLAAVLLAGAGLSIAGLIMQQLCANKFVSPTTGATIASAQLGILFAFVFLPSSTLVSRTLFAFAAAMAGTLAFSLDMTQALSTWVVGHFSLIVRGHYEMVYLVLPLVALAWIYARHFNIVGMGRDFSKNLGVSYTKVLLLGLVIASAITASIVSVAGAIPYIGLVVPNIISIWKGDDLRNTLADTALFGALFVLGCDLISRLVISPYELPIELITGSVGSLVFIGLILRRLGVGRGRRVRRGAAPAPLRENAL